MENTKIKKEDIKMSFLQTQDITYKNFKLICLKQLVSITEFLKCAKWNINTPNSNVAQNIIKHN